ncbi:MAG: putative N-acetyl-mannosamine transferase [Firmicutes bacterium]|nr:putative N-acetyl-mannosamine transferase [Bacillota bacterium]
MSRTQILTIGVDKVTMAEAVARCVAFVRGDQPRLVVTPNAEIAYAAAHNPELTAIINGADLVIPDGIGVVLASKLLGEPVPEKVTGVDLSTNLLAELSRQGGGRIFLLGAEPGVAAEAARRITERFPGVTVVGHQHGFFTPAEEPAIIARIRAAAVDALFVGLGSPRQERWLSQHLPELGARVSLGVGGTINVWAGVASRGPDWMIRANLEWLYRVVKFGRYGRSLPPLAKFMLAVTALRLRGR